MAGLFPGVTGRDVVASWAGLRPLLGQDDAGDTTSSDLSRKHAVFSGPFGLYTITGGKLTTYRAMAEDLVDRVAAELGGAGPVPDAGDPAGAARAGRRGGAAGPGRGERGWGCRRAPPSGWCSATATTGGRRPG